MKRVVGTSSAERKEMSDGVLVFEGRRLGGIGVAVTWKNVGVDNSNGDGLRMGPSLGERSSRAGYQPACGRVHAGTILS